MARGLLLAGAVVSLLGGCAQLPRHDIVTGPTTAQPQPPPRQESNGSIFQAAYNKPLFEDRRPRQVGDILTIVLNEDLSATKSSAANASRQGSVGFNPTAVPAAIGNWLSRQDTDISGTNDFQGSGDANASNTFTGRITVTVMQVLPNGNLQVAGEKRIGINQGTEFLLFSGVVNPRTIGANSTVTSSQVANARLEYYGDGYIDEAQHMGWLQRALLNISPF
ncbi:flagellar basal body L-ring protein FlgH [Salinisphaera sp. Q1T1-3]|uniref:flagellar basal body L-ring protein FlgH n=1 Tax=Salinisphaera sp. Q1T1-3 TaxID=2321229 RepID=UPI000E733AF8|nr:flagellar basal body L-ring protein FlgH [Salinisphaera sp. Q1T1-3]RJS95399.1 flagellar basal body L-ring protein [Salinisphaera sp. Q1T1-3]